MAKTKTLKIERLLAALGKTLSQIRKKLNKEKVRGDLKEPKSCVIANYLKRNGVRKPAVYPMLNNKRPIEIECNGQIIEGSKTLNGFAINFDAGKYPELVK
jgi:hypothetical protein